MNTFKIGSALILAALVAVGAVVMIDHVPAQAKGKGKIIDVPPAHPPAKKKKEKPAEKKKEKTEVEAPLFPDQLVGTFKKNNVRKGVAFNTTTETYVTDGALTWKKGEGAVVPLPPLKNGVDYQSYVVDPNKVSISSTGTWNSVTGTPVTTCNQTVTETFDGAVFDDETQLVLYANGTYLITIVGFADFTKQGTCAGADGPLPIVFITKLDLEGTGPRVYGVHGSMPKRTRPVWGEEWGSWDFADVSVTPAAPKPKP